MVKLEMNFKQIEQAINGLSLKDRAKLVERLMKDTWEERFEKLRNRIRARVKKYPITQEEIDQEVEEAKREYHAKSRH